VISSAGGGGGATGREREVVFARSAFVGVAFDGDAVIAVLVQPLCLAGKRLLGVGADDGRIRIEEDAVADIDGEVLAGPRRRRDARTGTAIEAEIGGAVRGLLAGAACKREAGNECDDQGATGDGCDTAHGRLSFALVGFVEYPVTTMRLTEPQQAGLHVRFE